MTFQALAMNVIATRSDRKRDKAIPLPTGVTECRNISYGPYGDWNLLDVYCPEGTAEALPTIVSIHGGGYVYGNKEVYRRYGMDMAKRGFVFVNFNYRLAPKWKFPTPLADTNAVMEWVCKNANRYHMDPQRIIILGDSAGAQLTSQYAAICTNAEYAKLFHLNIPNFRLRAVGLNCGMYDMGAFATPLKGLALDYLGRIFDLDDPRLKVLENITGDFPPAFITTAYHDFLRENAEPMCSFLAEKGIPCDWRCYGSEDDKSIGHVFHVTITHPEAIRCNDDSAAFFMKHI